MKENSVVKELKGLTGKYLVLESKEKRYEYYFAKGFITKPDYVEGVIDTLTERLKVARKIYTILSRLPKYRDLVSPNTLEIYHKVTGLF